MTVRITIRARAAINELISPLLFITLLLARNLNNLLFCIYEAAYECAKVKAFLYMYDLRAAISLYEIMFVFMKK